MERTKEKKLGGGKCHSSLWRTGGWPRAARADVIWKNENMTVDRVEGVNGQKASEGWREVKKREVALILYVQAKKYV